MLSLSITDVILISKYDWAKIASQASTPLTTQRSEPLLAPYDEEVLDAWYFDLVLFRFKVNYSEQEISLLIYKVSQV